MKYWPDFVKLADAYGIPGYYVDDPAKLEATLKEALIDNKGPALLDIRISKEENVMPMVPAGHAINNIIQKYE
jgi:acetolactate synthase-1/2/3 large subunit